MPDFVTCPCCLKPIDKPWVGDSVWYCDRWYHPPCVHLMEQAFCWLMAHPEAVRADHDRRARAFLQTTMVTDIEGAVVARWGAD